MLDPKWMRFYGVFSTAVLTKAVFIFFAYKLGTYLDKTFGTYPFGLFGCVVIAAGLGIWWILFLLKRIKL